VFGAVASRVNFCAMGAIIDIAVFSDWGACECGYLLSP
jgi:hypothetical protein